MNRDLPPEQSPTTFALVDALVEQFRAFDQAVSRADLTRATRADLHQLIAAVAAADAALAPVLAMVDATTPAS